MSNELTDPYVIEHSPGVFICPPAYLVPGSPEAAIADWSTATKALVVDRQAREYAAQNGGAR